MQAADTNGGPLLCILGGYAGTGKHSRRRGGDRRRFYTTPHQYSCGIGLHARTLSACILHRDGENLVHRHRLFEVQHILPQAHVGADALDNLALACHACNRCKSAFETGQNAESRAEVALVYPRRDVREQHFGVNEGTAIVGITPVGRATVVPLQMNRTWHITHAVAGESWDYFLNLSSSPHAVCRRIEDVIPCSHPYMRTWRRTATQLACCKDG